MRSIAAVAIAMATFAPASASAAPRNVVLFVADGFRPRVVDERTAPAIAALMRRGVRFADAHSMFTTFTTPNASAMATGHKLGDTGDFSNVLDASFEVPGAGGSLTPFLESDPVLGDVDEHFSGDYLNQETVMKAARLAGYSTATIGKLGPCLIFDNTDRSGRGTVAIDDTTGRPGGIPLSDEISNGLKGACLAVQASDRGANAAAGRFDRPGTLQPNTMQQDLFLAAVTKVVLPLFKERGRPFMMVFWSRDPDGTQHNQGDAWNGLSSTGAEAGYGGEAAGGIVDPRPRHELRGQPGDASSP